MSQKVEDGLSYLGPGSDKGFLLLRSPREDIGGWYLGKDLDLESALTSKGWGWREDYEEEHVGAALVAPLTVLYWSNEE